MEKGTYWYNLRTGQVETIVDKSQSKDLLGPYPTYEAALRALQTARERTTAWDEDNRRWDEDD
ncbi:MAG: hypothetical protein QG608_3679 [Actinomycetota bacterium]|nr:hypothetical protein [Actinomycetota bacterium]